ncbi:ankyrin repeat domain-containing protein 9-like [Amphiura filiformis]|uniref:ankyrin repeat domain-containing protein 9-like n=1 Tax=Amphiura filiformis TaxID=82378 RepID=UPI003B20B9A9
MVRSYFVEYEIGMREHRPVKKLERLRKRIAFDWESEEKDRHLSLSEALMMAIHYDHIEMVEYLLKHNMEQATEVSKWSRSHLICAVDRDKTDIVEKLLQYTMTSKGKCESNALVNEINNFNSDRRYVDRKGGCRKFGTSRSAIHVACKLGRIQCLELLLQYGADPSVTDHLGFTALGYTIMRLCHGRQIQNVDEPVFDCIELLVRALPNFRLSRYILPRLWQFADEDLDEEKENAQEEDDADDSDLSTEEGKKELNRKKQDTVRRVLGKMSNVRKLQHLCRHSVRRHVVAAQIGPEIYDDLPLPKMLNSYVESGIGL